MSPQQACSKLQLTSCDNAVPTTYQQDVFVMYTRKNAQVVTGLQTSCYESVHKLSTSCVRTACSQLL
jgi:uncharacterized protein